MAHAASRFAKPRNIWMSMVLGAILPILLGFILANYYSDWRWAHYPFHSMVESVGAVSAITISVLMILMVNHQHLPRYYIWPACALISMGLLDGAHAVLHAGDAFVWLHSVATLMGGLIFAGIWLPEHWLTAKRQRMLIIFVSGTAFIISMVAIVSPHVLPSMIFEGEFTFLAELFNFAGGAGFLMGTAYFVRHKLVSAKQATSEQDPNKDLVFANHCLLFGIAGLLFEISVIWDAGWWWWHGLRLAAYLVVLVYFFVLFKQQQDTLTANEAKLSNINKQLEQRVYERTRELEKASQAKSEFLSHMSHELRTPMNAVLGFAQVLDLDSEGFKEEQRSSVKEILVAGQHLLALINEILDLAKIESGKQEVSMEAVNLNELMRDCLVLMQTDVTSRQLEVIDNVSGKGYVVLADSIRLKQVLLNLISNAIKYNKANGNITLTAERTGNQRLLLRVTDTGEGLTQSEIARLFVPFERLHAKGNIEGAGIGLIITRHLVTMMGGTVGVESSKGEGSTFWVELALANN